MKFLTLITLLFTGFNGIAQTQFWSDDFEDAGSPSSGSRTLSLSEFYCTGAAYFTRTTGSSPAINAAYSGFANSKFFAAADIDRGPTCSSNSISPGQSITWSSINISGKSGLSFKGFFGAESSAVFQGLFFANSTNNFTMDSMAIEYRIDGGAWQKIIGIYPNDATASGGRFALDTDNNRIGDGTLLGNTLSEFSANISGTGTTLDLRFDIFLNNGAPGSISIDNFRLFETPSCTAPVITANPPNRSICVNGNTTFTGAATGATALQWQVNTGSGFTDITNGGVYSNATTNTLTIIGATAGMNGYQYRLVAINGVASCFTNSNAGTLNISNITSSSAQNNVSCNGISNGSAAVSPTGGIGSYTYSWSPSGGTASIATGLSAGSYTVTITDAISCQITKNFTITQPPVLNGTTVVTNVTCFGGNTGAINLTPSGGTPGYTFNWVSGPTTEDRTSLTAGSYSVTITDANGCTKTVSSITVTQPAAAISGTTVVTNVACNGGNTGAINLTPTGGVGPYTFNWGGGVTAEDRTSLTAGSYSVTITDANGCTGIVNATVTQPTAISGTTVVTNVACNGGNTGAINLTPTGGVGPYTYNWGGGVTTEDRTSLTAGAYSVTITDANGCTGTVNATVTQPTAISGTTVVTNVACFGGNTGAINLTPTGGVGPYTYNWGGGVTSEDRTSLTAGSYSVTITDANGCTGTVSPTVTQPAAAVSGTTVVTNVACNGGNTGAINLTPTGGVGPYTFNWGGGVTTEDRTSLTAGSYSVTITDANGCTGTVSPTVTQPTAISLTASSQTNVSCNGGANGAAAVNAATGGAGGYTYNWTPGNPTGDGTTSVTGLTAGTWTCTVTDANACVASVNFTVTQPTAISLTAATQTNVSCNGGANGAAAVNAATGGAGGYTYNWTPGNPIGDGTTSVSGLTAGTWTCTVTDANACVASVNFTVTQPTAISLTAASQTNVACNGGSTGAAAVNAATGGAGGYTYDWTPGTPTGDGTVSVTGLAAGTYTVTVTDANACTASQSFTITEPTAISLTASSQTNVSCNGGANGAAAVNAATGGAGGYTYDWTPGNPTGDGTVSVTGLAAGTYTVTVTDANACTASQSFTITEPTAISLTAASQTNVACSGGSTGAATVNAATGGAGGYTYDWTPGTPTGDGTVSVTDLAAGTYTVTVTDANACTASQSFTITEPTAISLTAASQTNVACNGGSTGAATVNAATGGAGGYTYDWTPGNPTGDGTTAVTDLAAGTYTVTVTDANACTASQSFTITEPTAISLTAASQTNVACNGGSTGAATVNAATGGAGGYTYDWTPGNPTGDGTTAVTDLAAGTYTVTVTDANACTASQSFTITEPTAISITTDSQTDVSCNGSTDGAASINAPVGGTPGYTYDWAPGTPTGDGTASVTDLAAGTYTVTVTDANGCTADQTFTITQPAAITNSFSASDCDSYTWNSQTYTTSGTYTQVLTSALGCDSTVTLNLTLNFSTSETLNVTACESYTLNSQTYTTSGTFTQTLSNALGCDSTITLNLIINTADADTTVVTACDSLVWNGQTFTTSGFYTMSFTNMNGCDSIENLDLTIVPSPVAGITSLDVITLQASGTGTYQWITCAGQELTGETNATFTATSNGSYAVVVSNGSCSDTSDCVVISHVGLNEYKGSFGVTLTPNPTQNNVKVTFTGSNEASIIIYDAKGKVVMSVDHAQTGEVLSVEAFERGVYLVHIVTNSGSHTERLVKQ
ncbi:T9SS type A sorting domain-containing protein [Fluviicola chungangensis]|nr:T9SS type A sorting domain-containing protein [Fluviicola chungangensis]